MNKKIVVPIIILIIAIFGIYLFMSQKNPGPTAVSVLNSTQSSTQSAETTQTPQNNSSTNYDIQGMKVEILKEGTGEGAKAADNIVVNYVGTLIDGTKFDSSIDRNQPFPYTLGQNMVIKGWELGLLGMKVGEKRKLTIPYELAYGEAGRPPVIPAKATLIFEIDMLSINGK
jgi:FKBP-type peptidyl-prolyl cis-trans isomerase